MGYCTKYYRAVTKRAKKGRKTSKKIKIIIKVMPVCLSTQDLKLCIVYNYMCPK